MIAAERTLRIVRSGTSVSVPIQVNVPRNDRTAWICDFSIGWPEGKVASHAAGLDGPQALLFALQMVAIHLYASPYHKAGTLIFDEPGDGYGFPLPFDSRDLAIGLDKSL